MKFTGTLLFISGYLALVSCDPIVSITSPLTNTVYKAGSEAIISWINPTIATIPQIVLAKGKSNALQPLQVIATNVNAQDKQYVWKIPMDIESGDDYAFELGNSPDLAFAGPFKIEGKAGGSPAGNSSSSVPAAAPAAPAGNAANPAPAPASPAATAGTSTAPHNANSSHPAGSAANKQQIGSLVAAFGLITAIASQLF